jgi:hypothetical protein
LAPAGLFGREIEHVPGPRRLVEQSAAVGDGILPRGGGEFIDEAFDHEGVVGHPDAAPPAGGEARWGLLPDIVDEEVGEVIGTGRAFDRIAVDAVAEAGRKPPCEDR